MNSTSRNAGLVLALTLAFSVALANDMTANATQRPTVAGISEGLTCQCGCGLTVANCNHPTCSFSVPVREEIETMIGKGESGPQIIAFYRQKFGEKVLSAPTTEGFNVLAWLMPFAAVLLGGAFIVFTASRWRSRRNGESAASSDSASNNPPVEFDPALKSRLDNDLRERR